MKQLTSFETGYWLMVVSVKVGDRTRCRREVGRGTSNRSDHDRFFCLLAQGRNLSTDQIGAWETPIAIIRFPRRAGTAIRRAVMRTVNFFVTASVFSSVFIGLALVSAVVTGAVHAQFSSRSIPMTLAQN
jgi:hypothetical protein